MSFNKAIFNLAVCVLLGFPAAGLAEPGGSGRGGGGGEESADVLLSVIMTTSTVRNIQSVQTECSGRDKIYQLDCLRAGLELVWRRLPYHGDYGTMRYAIQQGARALGDIVSQNVDPATPRLDSGLNANPRFQARRHYNALLKDNLDKAGAAARQVFDTLQGSLSQSDGKSSDWNESYGDVAAAIGRMSDSISH